jgi:hypothetical protein
MAALALFMELRNEDSCCAMKASWLRCEVAMKSSNCFLSIAWLACS